MNFLKYCLLAVFWLSGVIVTCNDCKASEQETLLVLGSFNELKNEQWKDARIGFGLKSLIIQSFFDTGAFTIIEEKPEIQEKLSAISQGMWNSDSKKYDIGKEAEEAKIMGAKYIAYGRVYYFGRPQTKLTVGLLQARVSETIIRIEIVLQNVENGKKIKKSGSGKTETTANSILFEVRDDSVLFDETAVGIATRKAISEAVADIIEDFEKIQ